MACQQGHLELKIVQSSPCIRISTVKSYMSTCNHIIIANIIISTPKNFMSTCNRGSGHMWSVVQDLRVHGFLRESTKQSLLAIDGRSDLSFEGSLQQTMQALTLFIAPRKLLMGYTFQEQCYLQKHNSAQHYR